MLKGSRYIVNRITQRVGKKILCNKIIYAAFNFLCKALKSPVVMPLCISAYLQQSIHPVFYFLCKTLKSLIAIPLYTSVYLQANIIIYNYMYSVTKRVIKSVYLC